MPVYSNELYLRINVDDKKAVDEDDDDDKDDDDDDDDGDGGIAAADGDSGFFRTSPRVFLAPLRV